MEEVTEPPFSGPALDVVEEAFFAFTKEGKLLQWNRRVNEVTGYSDEEIKGMHPVDFVPAEDAELIRKKIGKVIEEGHVRFESQFQTKEGERIPYEFTGSLLERKGQTIICGTGRNIADRKRAEEALKESEEMFRTLAEKSLAGIALLRKDEYVYVNPALAQITGRTPEELIGVSPEAVFHPEDRPAVRRRIRERIEEGRQEAHYEARMQAKDGEIRHVEVFGSRIDYQREPAIIGTVQDITDRRKLQRKTLRVQEEERRRLGQDLHDGVASQLTGVVLMLNGLIRKTERDDVAERIREIQTIIKESAGDVRRLSRGLNPGGLSEGDLPSALRRLAENIEGTRFKNLFEAEGPEHEDGEMNKNASTLNSDRATHLYRIAQEAVANARRHGEAENIEIRLGFETGNLVLEIEDNGTGFDPEEIGEGGPKEEGLGLRSMRHRAELLGADLTIDSASGGRTLVRCQLPM